MCYYKCDDVMGYHIPKCSKSRYVPMTLEEVDEFFSETSYEVGTFEYAGSIRGGK